MPHVTFIHGLANKPQPDELLRIWREALAYDDGIDLGTSGVTSSMIYWADVLYESPAQSSAAHESTGAEAITEDSDEDTAWRQDLSGAEKEFVDSLAARFRFDVESPEGDDYQPPETADYDTFEAVPLPWFIKRRLMKALLRDLHHYAYNVEHSPRPGVTYRVQDEIRSRFVDALEAGREKAGAGKHVVVSHSMGTVIAYDCLKRVGECPAVDSLVTLGSPLGLEEVQHKMKPEWTSDDGFPAAKIGTDWINVYDRLDVVAAADPRIANDYKRRGEEIIADINEQNWGRWRHDITKYLKGETLRQRLSAMLEI